MTIDHYAFESLELRFEGLGRVEDVYGPRLGKVEFVEERSHRTSGLCEA